MSSSDMVIAVVGGTQGIATAGQGISMLSATGQAIAGVVSAVAPIGGAIAINPAAGLITLIKIGLDASNSNVVNMGDAISLVGNSASVAAAVCMVVPGGQALGLTLGVVGRALAISGILISTLDVNYPLVGPPFPATSFIDPAAVSSSLGTTPDPLVKTIRYVDPLILDLDGDGIEITPLSRTPPVLFDADADTVRTGTAWAAADDGLLVFDRNGNGIIDSGRELFGDETLLGNGQKAPHGFAALSELDSNHDGQFNAADSLFSEVRIWRDLDQDGISDAGELKTLADSGVQSIAIASAAMNTNYGDAVLVQSGSFTRTSGSTGQVGSFILAQNSFVRQFAPIAVSAAAKALPDIAGSGWVRDLQEAATQSPELIAVVGQAVDATTRAGYQAAVASLLREWGNDSAYNSAGKQALAAGYGLIYSEPQDAQERGWMDTAVKASEADRNAFRGTLNQADLSKFDAMRERMVGSLEKVYAYEAFTGYSFLNWSQILGDATNYIPRTYSSGHVPVVVEVPLTQILLENRNAVMSIQAGYIRVTIPEPPLGLPHVQTLWNRLVDDATTNLMPSLRLSRYLDMVDLNIDHTGVSFDFTRLDASIANGMAANTLEGAALVLDLNKTYGRQLDGLGWNGTDQVRVLMQQGLGSADIRSAFAATGYGFMAGGASIGTSGKDAFAGDDAANTFNGSGGDDLIDGQSGNDSLAGGQGNDLIFGGNDDDTLYGEDGIDTLDGGNGHDVLYGGMGADTLLGGSGNDELYGDGYYGGWGGNDTLDGGEGNDKLVGGMGNDTYLFGTGDGQDTILNYADAYNGTPDPGKVDVLRFKAGVAPSDVRLTRTGDDLVVKINGTSDQVTMSGYFGDDGMSSMAVDQIKFTDGTTWSVNAVKSLLSGNHMPVLSTALADKSVAQGQPLSFALPQGAFTDPDAADTLTYSATLANGQVLPAWLTFNAATHTFSGNSAAAGLGVTSIRVTAMDSGGLSANDVFDVTVQAAIHSGRTVINGTAANETLTASSAGSTIYGNGGNDTLLGSDGNDVLVAGHMTPGLHAEYFNNQNLSGAPVLARDENIDFQWTTGSPGPGVNTDNFSVRWGGQLAAPSSGRYELRWFADDTFKVYIDNELVINQPSYTGQTATISLDLGSGDHTIVAEMVEGGGWAAAQLQWKPPGAADFTPVPLGSLASGSVAESSAPGLHAEYFNNRNWAGAPALVRNENIDFQWTTGSPGAGVNADNFSVRWSGQLQAASSGAYELQWFADDELKVYIDNQLVINQASYTGNAGTTSVNLGSGAHTIVAEMVEGGGWAAAQLHWKPPGSTDFVPVPLASLSSGAAAAATTPGMHAEYFNNQNWAGAPALVRDESIDFQWTTGSPGAGVNADNFSVRWSGELAAASTGAYDCNGSQTTGSGSTSTTSSSSTKPPTPARPAPPPSA